MSLTSSFARFFDVENAQIIWIKSVVERDLISSSVKSCCSWYESVISTPISIWNH